MTLDKWQVKINDSYYVLPRRKEQPWWTYQENCDEVTENFEGTFNIAKIQETSLEMIWVIPFQY